jgi:amino acid transporter
MWQNVLINKARFGLFAKQLNFLLTSLSKRDAAHSARESYRSYDIGEQLMDVTPTILILLMAMVAFAWSWHKASQPFNPLKPRMVPYTGLMFIAAVVGLYMIVHLVNLAGFETGRR